MNVAGFEEALASAFSNQIEETLVVRVASIPGLALLKLVAWSDRSRQTIKDAADIYQLLAAYADAGNTDRLYDQEMVLLGVVGFDMQLAGAELLGRDVARLCSPPALGLVQSILQSEPIIECLVNHMVQTSTFSEAAPVVEQMLISFRRGLLKDT
jgi:predicted nucleotidyltransferase